MKLTLILVISIFLGIAFLFAIIKLLFSSIQKKLNYHIQNKYDEKTIIAATSSANFFGEQSKGGRQLRGNGGLVLTKDEVYFIRALPFKEYVIPLDSITEVSLPESFNGRSVFSKLLCVRYKTNSGSDAIAWAVKNPESWKEAIEKLVSFDCY